MSLQNGDKLTGILEMHQFRLGTASGKLEPELAQINRMTFTTSPLHGLPAGSGPPVYSGGNLEAGIRRSPETQRNNMSPYLGGSSQSLGSSHWTAREVAAPDSVEGQLRSRGKHWVRATGETTVGAYVQDILEGRLGQPKGRGAIGKVVSLSTEDNGKPVAMVDFGRGYSVGIFFSELSVVGFVSVTPEP